MGSAFDGAGSKGTAVDLRTPSGFVRSIGLRPTAMQQSILDKFDIIENFTSVYDKRNEIARAFALGLLWQTLSSRGSKSTVISSDDETGLALMRFMKQVLKTGPQQLLDICNFPAIERIQFGSDPGWNILYLRAWDVRLASKRGAQTRSALILRENTSDTEFCDAKNALTGSMTAQKKRIIHLW